MVKYFAYGLHILSEIPLPELTEVKNGKADVIIRQSSLKQYLPKKNVTQSFFHMASNISVLFWPEVGTFVVKQGKEIIVDPANGTETELIRLPLLGIVLAAVLQQRRYYGLHASAIALKEEAAAFIGGKGMGKSTLASMFYSLGKRLITDDLLALEIKRSKTPVVLPGFPQLKIMPEIANNIFGRNPVKLHKLAANVDKYGYRATKKFSQKPLPLKFVYVLNKGKFFNIEKMTKDESFINVFGNSVAARAFKSSLKGVNAKIHFLQCLEIINQTKIYKIEYPHSLASLRELAYSIEEHAIQNR